MAPVASLVIVPQNTAVWLSVSLKWLGGVSCLSAAWYFVVLAPWNPAWVWISYSRSDNHCRT